MKLPKPERAFIDDGKLSNYSLNPKHDEGKHKARVFRSALGITLENVEELKTTLLEAVKTYEAVPAKANA